MDRKNEITLEGVLAGFDAMLAKSAAEFDRKLVQSRTTFDLKMQELREFQAETAKQIQQSNRQITELQAETARQIQQVNQQIGGTHNSNGAYAEDFFYNTIFHGKRSMFGEVFYDVVKNDKITANRGYEDEYDILLINGRAVCVVEVKYKADSADLTQKVLRKAQTFRANFPQHKEKAVYLALAALSFHPLTEEDCKKNGIAIMKQVGDTVAIYDENLKTF